MSVCVCVSVRAVHVFVFVNVFASVIVSMSDRPCLPYRI